MRHVGYYLNYANKILVFLDMPNTKLLEHLRVLMAHDKKITIYKIVDKKKGLRTKTVIIEGYFTTNFATASTKLENQDATRNYQLAPTDSPSKISKALELQSKKKYIWALRNGMKLILNATP